MKKQTVEIILKDIKAMLFFLHDWKKKDYNKDVEFIIDKAKIYFKFVPDSLFCLGKNKISVSWEVELKIVIDNPDSFILNGLKGQDDDSMRFVADYIYDLYQKTIERISFLGLWAAKLSKVLPSSNNSFNDLFYENTEEFISKPSVYWMLNGKDKGVFRLENPEKIKTLGQNKSILLTPKKWEKIIEYSKKNKDVDKEILELFKIKNNLYKDNKRIVIVETISLIEFFIMRKVQSFLKNKGQSKTKIDNSVSEVGFSTLLNILLPAILTKGEMQKCKPHIDQLDNLRKIRNNVIHNNLSNDKIDIEDTRRGIGSAIEVIKLLNIKYK